MIMFMDRLRMVMWIIWVDRLLDSLVDRLLDIRKAKKITFMDR